MVRTKAQGGDAVYEEVNNMPSTWFWVDSKKPDPKAFSSADPGSAWVRVPEVLVVFLKESPFLGAHLPSSYQPTFSYLSLANWVSKMDLRTAHSPNIINQCQTKQAPAPAENTAAWLIPRHLMNRMRDDCWVNTAQRMRVSWTSSALDGTPRKAAWQICTFGLFQTQSNFPTRWSLLAFI